MLLRPALELAWAVASLDQRAVPPIPPPRPLRPLLRFAKLPDRALATVRRVLEDDEAFRARVAEAAEAASAETGLGRAGWLWLVRPDGWAEELAGLGAVAAETAASARDDHEERNARRRLAAANEARVRAEAAAATAQAAASRAGAELAVERQARRAGDTRAVELERQIAGLQERLRAAELSGTALEVALAESRAATDTAEAERDRLAATVASLESDLTSARGRVDSADASAAAGQADLARAIADAAIAAQALGSALASASGALGAEAPYSGPERSGPLAVPPPEVVRLAPKSAPAARVAEPRRQPARLPPAVFDDSPAAAAHLVRVPGMALLVDGYNVSKRAWDDLAIPEQRRRLTDALAELAARTGVETHLFFDGAEQPGASALASAPRSIVKTRFSPPEVDADEVIIEFVDQLPRHRPVVVATNDRRVQDEVRARGANVISAGQLLGLLGRAH